MLRFESGNGKEYQQSFFKHTTSFITDCEQLTKCFIEIIMKV